MMNLHTVLAKTTCQCQNSSFVNKNYGHILSIVEEYNYPLLYNNTPKNGVNLSFTPLVLFNTLHMSNFTLKAIIFSNQYVSGV